MMKCTGERCPMQVGYDVANCQCEYCSYRTAPTTNYDRIRNMSVEEMAELICESNCQKFCTLTKNGKCNVFEGGRQTCIMGIKQYLESEVDTE